MNQTVIAVWQGTTPNTLGLLGLFTDKTRAEQYISGYPNIQMAVSEVEVNNVTTPLETGTATWAVFVTKDPIAYMPEFTLYNISADEAVARATQATQFSKLEETYGKQDPVFLPEWVPMEEVVINSPFNPQQ